MNLIPDRIVFLPSTPVAELRRIFTGREPLNGRRGGGGDAHNRRERKQPE